MLTLLAKLFSALNSESAPGQVAFAFALAMIVGFTPFLSVINLFVVLVVMFLRINVSAFLLGVLVFSAIGYMIDPLSIMLGEWLLLKPELRSFWTDLYQNEWMRVLAFNHTVTLGGFCIALIALLPMTLIMRQLVIQYRHRV
ncbi:MAG: TIGR03546 family protein, partial [Oleibacter sp.]|nr:TIGR03546 family protein [Thalassolituus sp.]